MRLEYRSCFQNKYKFVRWWHPVDDMPTLFILGLLEVNSPINVSRIGFRLSHNCRILNNLYKQKVSNVAIPFPKRRREKHCTKPYSSPTFKQEVLRNELIMLSLGLAPSTFWLSPVNFICTICLWGPDWIKTTIRSFLKAFRPNLSTLDVNFGVS